MTGEMIVRRGPVTRISRHATARAEDPGLEMKRRDITRNQAPVNRTNAANSIQQLGVEAQIPEGKDNACALWKIWVSTRASIEANLELLVEQAMERQLEEERLPVGWGV